MTLREIGARCKIYRKGLGYCQIHVAQETGYSKENVSAFETGRNDNSRIMLWYLQHGMTVDEITGGTNNAKSV